MLVRLLQSSFVDLVRYLGDWLKTDHRFTLLAT